MQFSFVLWSYHSGKDKTFPLKLRVYFDTTDTTRYYKTGIRLAKNQWNGKIVKEHPDRSGYNVEIERVKIAIETLYFKQKNISPDEIRAIIKGGGNLTPPFGPVQYYKKYADDCEAGLILHKKKKTRMSPAYIKTIRCNAKYLDSFNKLSPVRWEDINDRFYDRFVTHMRDTLDLEESTIGKSIKILKTITGAARKDKLHDNVDFRDYSVPASKSFKLKLTEAEVKAMATADVSDIPELQAEQDRFQVAYNFMLRFRDSITIKKDEIVKTGNRYFLNKKTQKTGAQVLIPIQARVYEILKRNKFKITGSNSKSNERLKKLGLRAKVNSEVIVKGKPYKKYQLIKTHTTRRSAATHLYNSGMDPEIIMMLGGWSSQKQMMDYIEIDLEVKAKIAAEHPFFK